MSKILVLSLLTALDDERALDHSNKMLAKPLKETKYFWWKNHGPGYVITHKIFVFMSAISDKFGILESCIQSKKFEPAWSFENFAWEIYSEGRNK